MRVGSPAGVAVGTCSAVVPKVEAGVLGVGDAPPSQASSAVAASTAARPIAINCRMTSRTIRPFFPDKSLSAARAASLPLHFPASHSNGTPRARSSQYRDGADDTPSSFEYLRTGGLVEQWEPDAAVAFQGRTCDWLRSSSHQRQSCCSITNASTIARAAPFDPRLRESQPAATSTLGSRGPGRPEAAVFLSLATAASSCPCP